MKNVTLQTSIINNKYNITKSNKIQQKETNTKNEHIINCHIICFIDECKISYAHTSFFCIKFHHNMGKYV